MTTTVQDALVDSDSKGPSGPSGPSGPLGPSGPPSGPSGPLGPSGPSDCPAGSAESAGSGPGAPDARILSGAGHNPATNPAHGAGPRPHFADAKSAPRAESVPRCARQAHEIAPKDFPVPPSPFRAGRWLRKQRPGPPP